VTAGHNLKHIVFHYLKFPNVRVTQIWTEDRNTKLHDREDNALVGDK
jgi:hypothetical protein